MSHPDIFTRVKTNGGYWIEQFLELWKRQVQELQEKFSDRIEEVRFPDAYPTDVPIVYVKKDAIQEVLLFLKTQKNFHYTYLMDLTATDEMHENFEHRFEVVYQLYALEKGPRIRVKVKLKENETIPSVTKLWTGADWPEREVYDMFGIKFDGHPNLRRILMDYRWEGYPLRKDYPIDGYQVFPTAEAPDPERLK